MLNKFGIGGICPIKLITGHKCLGCGMTQAILYILKGDFIGAMSQNPRVVIVFPLLLYVWLKYLYMNFVKNTKRL